MRDFARSWCCALVLVGLFACNREPGLRMTAVDVEGVNVTSTRMFVHREGCGSPEIPEDAMRLDGPVRPRLSAGTWTVVVQGMDDCKVIAQGCAEVQLPTSAPVTVMLEEIVPVPLCSPCDDCQAGQCVAPSASVETCDGLDHTGYCNGDTLIWCDPLEGYKEVDCSEEGHGCGWKDDIIGFDCLDDDVTPLLTLSEIVGCVDYTIREPYGTIQDEDGHAGWSRTYCGDYANPPDMHCGLDLSVPRGTELYVPADATVYRFAGATGAFTDDVIDTEAVGDLRFKLSDETVIIFGHTSDIEVEVGDVVNRGTYVARSGSFEGPRLHIEVRVLNEETEGDEDDRVTIDPLAFFDP